MNLKERSDLSQENDGAWQENLREDHEVLMSLVIYECCHVWILSNLDKNDLFLGLSSLFIYLEEGNASAF